MLMYLTANYHYYQVKVFNLPGDPPADLNNNAQSDSNLMEVYPNPNNGSFFIKIDSKQQGVSNIELFSTNGELINTYKCFDDLTSTNVHGLSDGLYFLNARSGTLNVRKKVILRK